MNASRRKLLGGMLGVAAASLCGCEPIVSNQARGREVVSLWFAYGGKNREVLEQLVARFNASQPRVFVHATFQGDYFEALAKLRTALAAGAAPAMSHVVGEVVPYLHEAGVLEPLDSYEGAGSLELVDALAQSGTYLGGCDKPLVALPFNRSTPIMYCNRAMLRDAGLQPPATWQELMTTAQALTRRDAAGNVHTWGFECPISWWFWVALVGQAGGTVMRSDGHPELGGEAGAEAIRLWQRMIHEHRSMRPPPGRDYNAWEVTNQDFLAQRAAVIVSSTAFLRYLEQNARFEVLAAPMPSFRTQAVPTGGTFFVVLKTAPVRQKQAAWEFLRWMMLPDQTIEWATGTGYLPVSREAVARLERQHYYRQHPNDRVAMDQLAYAMPWPWAPKLFQVQREVMDPMLEETVLLNRNPADALKQARLRALHPG